MRISAKLSVIIAAIFAAVCFGVAITGFSSLGGISDPTQLDDAKGFAWFWAFLGGIGVVFGAVGLWLLRSEADHTAA
ncbi:MAG TPA: hypothetical protein VML58_17970 [Burkholderiaceae bacterium]|nr:hypothetical protein [Burkholderiaceae bacterium]